MAIWNFWRKREVVAKNAKDYFKAAEAVSKPTAFSLAALSFILVFAAVFGLIMAGKWGWDKLREDNSKQAEAPAAQAPTNDNEEEAPVTEQPQTTTPSTPAPQQQSTPQTSTPPTSIPNTGPDPSMDY